MVSLMLGLRLWAHAIQYYDATPNHGDVIQSGCVILRRVYPSRLLLRLVRPKLETWTTAVGQKLTLVTGCGLQMDFVANSSSRFCSTTRSSSEIDRSVTLL